MIYRDIEDLSAREGDYWSGRTGYTVRAMDFLKMSAPDSMLEIGPGPDCNAVASGEGYTGMDINPDRCPSIVHDAGEVPWPLEDDAVDAVIALQVWEHLGGRQQEAFDEAWRVAKKIIVLSIPYQWRGSLDFGHNGLTHDTMLAWASRRKWDDCSVVEDDERGDRFRRAVYMWRTDR